MMLQLERIASIVVQMLLEALSFEVESNKLFMGSRSRPMGGGGVS